MVRTGREWSPRGLVWIVLRTGDWNTDYDIYASEDLAWESVEGFMKEELPKMHGSDREKIQKKLDAGKLVQAFNLFQEIQSQDGNWIELEMVEIRH